MDPVILASARKHGVTDDDMLHAYRNPIRVFEFDELTMLIGADPSGRLRAIDGKIDVENGAYNHSGVSVMGAGIKGLGMLYRPDGSAASRIAIAKAWRVLVVSNSSSRDKAMRTGRRVLRASRPAMASWSQILDLEPKPPPTPTSWQMT